MTLKIPTIMISHEQCKCTRDIHQSWINFIQTIFVNSQSNHNYYITSLQKDYTGYELLNPKLLSSTETSGIYSIIQEYYEFIFFLDNYFIMIQFPLFPPQEEIISRTDNINNILQYNVYLFFPSLFRLWLCFNYIEKNLINSPKETSVWSLNHKTRSASVRLKLEQWKTKLFYSVTMKLILWSKNSVKIGCWLE